MEEELKKELEDLREENKILRDSLVEIRADEPGDDEEKLKNVVRDLGDLFHSTVEKAKETLGPGTEKLTGTLSRQMEENPIPILLAAFGAGFLAGRGLDRR